MSFCRTAFLEPAAYASQRSVQAPRALGPTAPPITAPRGKKDHTIFESMDCWKHRLLAHRFSGAQDLLSMDFPKEGMGGRFANLH